ncbi:uroporphyrinogen decarboxylase [Acinetobacter sp. ANC 4173]|uniref:uroporphyrinogen decarboxylase n=1 Tax=Acinetobacter sp. ANC 4173 TaxID=2529837 RepID=UPI0010391E3A|nr:uroporphyrinogen decarboxylase [Acinetobacter sp. ANC 4173]TCB79089.1 uroporphyrinogen decarboxylase [Acinetobacter sp. ANC 4173]
MTNFVPLQNNNFIRALQKQPVDRTPIWMMRQAGRYLPEYRAVRKMAGNFINLMKTPDYATEVTLQPIRRYDLDAAIVFSDILTIPDAMGLGLYFEENHGPKFKNPIRSEQAINNLEIPSQESLSYVYQTVSQCRHELNGQVPLIGFSGSPWTLACYMVEGQGSKDFITIKSVLYSNPKILHQLLEKNAQAVTQHLKCQVEAGAQAIMIFDTWGGLLSRAAYQEFSLRYITFILDSLKNQLGERSVPSIVFTKGGGQWLEEMAGCGANALGLDWMTDLEVARQRVGSKVALQGNLDPAVLLAPGSVIQNEVNNVMTSFGKQKDATGFVFNLGHGISKETNPDSVSVLIEAVHRF